MSAAATTVALQVDRAVVIALPGSERLPVLLRQWHRTPGLPPLRLYPAPPRPDDPTAGCLASHLAVLAAAGDRPVLVVEDDAVLAGDFVWPAAVPGDWELLWLGGQHRRPPTPVALPGWVRPADLVRTHCYAARRPAMVAAMLAGSPRIDPYLSLLELRQYAQSPFSVGQRAGRSHIDGRYHEQDRYWNAQSSTR